MADSISNTPPAALVLPQDQAMADAATGQLGISPQVDPVQAAQMAQQRLTSPVPVQPQVGMGDVRQAERQAQLDEQALLAESTDPSLQQQAVDPSQFAIPQQQQAMQMPQEPVQQPQDVQNYLQQFKVQQQAAGKIAQAQAQSAAQQAAEYEKAAGKLEVAQHQIENVKKDYQKNFDSTLKEFNDASDQVKNFKFQDYWDDKSTGQKIMAGIAILLGGYGAAKSGSEHNMGLEVINQTIDRDIQRQKANFEKLKDSAQMAQNKFALYNQKFDNERLAELAMRDDALQASQLKLQQIAEQNKSPAILEQAKAANAQLEQQRLQTKMMFEQQARQQALLKSLGAQSGRTLSPAEELALAKADPKAYEVYQAQQDKMIPASSVSPHIQGMAKNKEYAKAFQTYRADADTGIDALRNAIKFSKSYNAASPTDRAKMETNVGLLMGPLRTAMGLGVMSDSDREFLKGLIGNPNKILGLKSIEQAKLGIILNKAERDLDIRAEQAGLQVRKPAKLDFKK